MKSRADTTVTNCHLHNISHASELFPKRQILDSSKLKLFADDNFKFDENGRRFFKGVETTVGKGEIARYEQFLLFPTVFSKDLYCNFSLYCRYV